MTQQKQELSEDTKTIVTVLLLLSVTPIGILVMWFWPKWKLWVKVLVTLPVALVFAACMLMFLSVMGIAMMSVVNPKAQIEKAKCVTQCRVDHGESFCTNTCTQKQFPTPIPVVNP